MSEFPYSIDMFGISMTNIFIPITYFVSYYGLIFSHEKCTLKMVLFHMSITIMRPGKVPFSKLDSNCHVFPIKISVLQQRFHNQLVIISIVPRFYYVVRTFNYLVIMSINFKLIWDGSLFVILLFKVDLKQFLHEILIWKLDIRNRHFRIHIMPVFRNNIVGSVQNC